MDLEYLTQLVGQEAAEEILRRHQQEISRLSCRHAVAMAVNRLGGRSERAIRALLDEESIAAADDMEQAARQAVEQVQRQHGYLFAPPQVTAPGTGTAPGPGCSMEDIGKMSMAEYRRYRGM